MNTRNKTTAKEIRKTSFAEGIWNYMKNYARNCRMAYQSMLSL